MFNRKLLTLIGLLVVLSMLLVACGGGEEPTEAPAEAETGAEAEGTFLERARAGEFEGTTVSAFGAFVDEDARRFEETIKPFEDQTGIDVEYEGSGDFETLIRVRLEAGDAPDVAAHPQPGLLAGFVQEGYAVEVTSFLSEEFLSENYQQGWLDDATFEGPDGEPFMAGVWHRANVKSLVWYPKDDFEAAGYEIPTSWDELIALSDQIVADGSKPWCIGIESSGATGWVATDWIEDIMLRTTSPENYDRWVNGELDFNSPEVRNAVETMGEIWFNEDYVLGGTTGIINTPFGDAPTPMFDDPPSCWLHRQASFIPAFFPDDAAIGENVDFFYFPMIDEEYGEPVLTAGDIYAMYNDRPEVKAFMEFLATPESAEGWVKAGGFVSPHQNAPLDWYPTETDRRFAEILQNASVTRFDGSDLMPGAVGAGAFWTEITDYVGGGVELEQAMQNIDEAWPSE